MRKIRRLDLLGLAFAGATGLCGCASVGSPVRGRPEPVMGVRLVGEVPPSHRYLGRVSGEAPEVDFVEAAFLARADLRCKAAILGADMVKIDRVRVPPDRHRASRRHVLLSGRAYRTVKPHAPRARVDRRHPPS